MAFTAEPAYSRFQGNTECCLLHGEVYYNRGINGKVIKVKGTKFKSTIYHPLYIIKNVAIGLLCCIYKDIA